MPWSEAVISMRPNGDFMMVLYSFIEPFSGVNLNAFRFTIKGFVDSIVGG